MSTNVREYIGSRYVPIFGRKDEESITWDNTKPYEPLTIVLYQGNSYTSRQYVPVGVEITNGDFWALTGNYNAQVEAYRREVEDYTEAYGDAIDALDLRLDDIEDFIPETVIGFDTVADMKASTILENGMICHTNGFHSSGDNGAAYYKITNSGTANEMDIIACQNNLIAHLVITEPFVTFEMYGAYGDNSNDDTAILQYVTNLDMPIISDGIYIVSDTINVINDIDMKPDSWIKINDELTYGVTICSDGQRLDRFYRLNVDGNGLAENCIALGKVKSSRLELTAKNAPNIGILGQLPDTPGQNENIFNIHVTGMPDGSSNTGVYINNYDSFYENIITIDFKHGIDIAGGGVIIKNFHPWLRNYSNYWDNSIGIYFTGRYTFDLDWYYQDTIKTGIAASNSFIGHINIWYVNTVDTSTYGNWINIDCNKDYRMILETFYDMKSSGTKFKYSKPMHNQAVLGIQTDNYGITTNEQINGNNFTDVDDAPQIGTYYCQYSYANLPASNNGLLTCKIVGSYAVQEFLNFSNMDLWRRTRALGSTWGNWVQYTHA